MGPVYKGEKQPFDLLDDASLSITAATELLSPLALIRQLGISVTADTISDQERQLLGRQLTLTSERAIRLASSLAMTSDNQPQLALEPVNPVTVCNQVIRELTPMFAEHGQYIKLRQRTRIPLLVANRQALERVLLGFADNALYYGSSTHPVEFTISGHGKFVRIGVRDHGPAVPIDVWRNLETRVAKNMVVPIANRPHASGLRLLAAKKLATLMESMVGTVRHHDGATFYIDMRVSDQMSLL